MTSCMYTKHTLMCLISHFNIQPHQNTMPLIPNAIK